MKSLHFYRTMCAVFAIFFFVNCGSNTKNAFQSLEKDDPATEATQELEHDNPDAAIKIIESALAGAFDDYKLVSILSAAYAQKHEIDLITIALNMGTNSTSTQSGTNPINVLWPYLPEATDEHISGIEYAANLLEGIPSADRTIADSFKLALLSTIIVSIQLKQFDTDGDGQLSVTELLRMNTADAATVFAGLRGAISALASMSDTMGDGSNDASAKITEIYDALSNAEGASQEEKIASYFNASATN